MYGQNLKCQDEIYTMHMLELVQNPTVEIIATL
jgi:hypothetical protein